MDDAERDEDRADGPPPRLRDKLAWFALAVVAVAVIGLVAGVVFGRTSPERAASTLLRDLVVREEHRGDERTPSSTDDPAPTSGDHVGEARCGIVEGPVDPDTQLASLASGVVVVQYAPEEVEADEIDRLERWVADGRDDRVLLAPNPELVTPVMVTAWTRRLPLRDVELSLIGPFVTAYAGTGPRPAPCDPSAQG